MVLIHQNKGAKIILHAKSPTFREAKLKGSTVCEIVLVCLYLLDVRCYCGDECDFNTVSWFSIVKQNNSCWRSELSKCFPVLTVMCNCTFYYRIRRVVADIILGLLTILETNQVTDN